MQSDNAAIVRLTVDSCTSDTRAVRRMLSWLTVDDEMLELQSWGRFPAGHDLAATVGPEGAKVWLKDAPLQHPDVLRMPD